jgi:hypothetical protein
VFIESTGYCYKDELIKLDSAFKGTFLENAIQIISYIDTNNFSNLNINESLKYIESKYKVIKKTIILNSSAEGNQLNSVMFDIKLKKRKELTIIFSFDEIELNFPINHSTIKNGILIDKLAIKKIEAIFKNIRKFNITQIKTN